MDSEVAAALVAGVVSVVVGVISYLATQLKVTRQTRQSQLQEVLKKRFDAYAALWAINVRYETNWEWDGEVKDHEWARDYLAALNDLNVSWGLYFSEDLYQRFVDLRDMVLAAVQTTEPSEAVAGEIQRLVHEAVYGGDAFPGLSTHLKDDLGSYQDAALQRRGRPTRLQAFGRKGRRYLRAWR